MHLFSSNPISVLFVPQTQTLQSDSHIGLHAFQAKVVALRMEESDKDNIARATVRISVVLSLMTSFYEHLSIDI